MTLPFDHTHDLDPGVEISRSKSEKALSQEWDGRLTWNKKDVNHPFKTMILTSVIMVGWADVLDSDWGDFRCRHAVNISSSVLLCWSPAVSCYFKAIKNFQWILSLTHLPLDKMAAICQTTFSNAFS